MASNKMNQLILQFIMPNPSLLIQLIGVGKITLDAAEGRFCAFTG
jgi:hypothetical protein